MLGIIGGGQLARLLVLAAHRQGLGVRSLVNSKADPAAQVGEFFVRDRAGSIPRAFLAKLSAITFESEWLTAREADSLARSRIETFPRLELLQQLSDRASQKSLLDQFGIPTAPWSAVGSSAELRDLWSDRVRFPLGLVKKTRKGGYDGYGTRLARRPKSGAMPDVLLEMDQPSIVEALVPFDRELAVTLGRTKSGEIIAFPWVETHQVDSRCLWVNGPLRPSEAMKRLETDLGKVLQKTGYVGVLTAEVFAVGKRLLVNELAPRVHNSCHHSLDSMLIDQFEAHLLCQLTEKRLHRQRGRLMKNRLHAKTGGFCMVNLLGRADNRGHTPSSVIFNGRLHWYGKTEHRKGRKMGHINVLCANRFDALQRGLEDLATYGQAVRT